ncbi:hypothetical protein EA187_10430 [Lujinxingia sediminis]|uniref:EcxA zinc-binding domain-containing protein n=1 Tax=Lujinxingia sediminis TaxID=2480984 RepID=A0ABY0CUS7_9DELT|nr:zinc-dependent metalloprotease [Lujinxingia sediminis]RVU44939.1 hypothetical protein EA187_10430 [Lujinxingia sediminis]
MRLATTWQAMAGAVVAVALSSAVGCVEQVGDINRVQPNVVEKALFQNDDEWYMRQVVTDTDMQGSVIFAAQEGSLKRIRWTVTENFLYAHSTVELADGLMNGFDEEESRRLGVVAAYPIRGHFDIQRAYNTATGEPSNQIVENMSDRPWYERDYMRVAWDNNMIDGFWNFQSQLGRFAPAGRTVPQDDGHVDKDRARISEDYIDTVAEYSYEPDIYACYGAYGYDTIFSCEGGRVRVRSSFMKVPEVETFIPMQYTDNMQVTRDGAEDGDPMLVASIVDQDLGYEVEVECNDQVRGWMLREYGYEWERLCAPATFDYHQRFGYFRTERVAWDRFVGTADDTRRYYANRWNIWQTMLDENGNELPYSERIPQPITYHLNAEYPEFMFEAAQITAEEWNKAFRNAVKLAQNIDDEQLDTVLMDTYGHTKMYRIVENSCHPGQLIQWRNSYGMGKAADRTSPTEIFREFVGNPASDEALEAALWGLSNESRVQLCAELEFATETRDVEEERFTWERVGDLRYSFFNWVETDVPWAGYGPSAADPLTGEIISGNANFAGGYIRKSATYAADLMQYFNGELSDTDIMYGTQIRRDLFHDSDTASRRFNLTPEAKEEMARRSGVNPSQTSKVGLHERPEVNELHDFILAHGKDRIQREADIVSMASEKLDAQDERMVEFLQSPSVKNFLMRDVETAMAIEATARERFGPSFNDEQLHQAYIDVHTPRHTFARVEQRDRMLAERSIMTYDSLTRSAEMLVTYRGAADYFKGKSRADIIEYFMNKMFIGTQLHEIGHTVGLRHNFSASTDALNFHDEYWHIEQAVVDGTITREQAHSLQGELAEQIIGKDVDYASQAEYQLASVMDYTGDLTGRFQGLGKYDYAAIAFAYAEVVETWDDSVQLPNQLEQQAWLSDYKQMPRILAGAPATGTIDPAVYAQGIDILINGRSYMTINEAKERRRQGIQANTRNWANFDLNRENQPNLDRSVAYEFCSDEFRGGILNCSIWDFGANQREIVNHSFDTYRALQTFWRYRRHHISRGYENYSNYINRVYSTFQMAQEPFRYYGLYRFYNLGDYTDDLLTASIDTFNFYNEVMAMAEPGRFCKYEPANSRLDDGWYFDLNNTYLPAQYHAEYGECDEYIDIPKGIGNHYNFGFTDEYDYRIDRVGTYIDKMVASQSIFDINANFAQSTFFTDFRATNLSFWTVFKDEMLSMLEGVLLGDYSAYGGVIDNGKYDDPRPISASSFGLGLSNPQEGMPRIFTPQSINHEFNMMVGGLIYNSTWEDRYVDFAHYLKIGVTNGQNQPFGPNVQVKEFIHPVTGQVYQSADVEGRSVSGRMIDRANELLAEYHFGQQLLEDATPGTPAYEDAREYAEVREEQLNNVVAKMDMSRFVFDALGASIQR